MTSQSVQQAVSPLRARMIEDMSVRGFTEKTRNDYLRVVKSLSAFLRRSPDQAMPNRQFPIDSEPSRIPPRVRSSQAFGRRLIPTSPPSSRAPASETLNESGRNQFPTPNGSYSSMPPFTFPLSPAISTTSLNASTRMESSRSLNQQTIERNAGSTPRAVTDSAEAEWALAP